MKTIITKCVITGCRQKPYDIKNILCIQCLHLLICCILIEHEMDTLYKRMFGVVI